MGSQNVDNIRYIDGTSSLYSTFSKIAAVVAGKST